MHDPANHTTMAFLSKKLVLVFTVFVGIALFVKLVINISTPETYDGWKALNEQGAVGQQFFRKVDLFEGNAFSAPKGHTFVLMSCATPWDDDFNCAFYLPLTALAWERYGYRSVVFIAGTRDNWARDPTLNVSLRYLEQRDAVIIFVDTPKEHGAMVSQTLKLFAGNFHNFEDADYLLTAGWNQWPLNREVFLLPTKKELLVSNYNCCATFEWQKERHVALSMMNIGAPAQKWREIMKTGSRGTPADGKGIVEYFRGEFGEIVEGGSMGWNMDQAMASLRIGQWLKANGRQKAALIPRDLGKDRMNISTKWKLSSPAVKNDSLLLRHGYKEHEWAHVRPLLWQMYGSGSRPYRWCEEYVIQFRNTFPDRIWPRGPLKFNVQVKDYLNHVVGALL